LWRFSSDTVISDLAILSNQGELLQKYENPFDGFFTKIISTADGNIILAGVDYNDSLCIIKADEQANIFWQKKFFFGVCMNEPTEIIETNDGGFALSAFYSYTSCSWPVCNSVLIKMDTNGNEEWEKHYHDDLGHLELYSIKQTSDNGFITFGWIGAPLGFLHMHLRKLDSNGNTQWINNFEQFPYERFYGYDLEITGDEGFIVCGYDIDGKNDLDKIKTAKIDSEGNLLWYKNYDYIAGGYRTYITKIAGGYVVAFKELIKVPDWDFYLNLLAIDEDGNELWHQQYWEYYVDDLKTTSDTSILVSGSRQYIDDENDLFVLKIYKDEQTSVQKTIEFPPIIYPNPATDFLNIQFSENQNLKLQIIDISGQIYYSGEYTANMNVSSFPNGFYIVKLINPKTNEIYVTKFIKQ